MRGGMKGFLTSVNRHPFLGPVLAVGTLAVALAIVGALAGWHRDAMLYVAAGAGAAVALPALFVIYRQLGERRDTSRALRNVEARVGGIVESAMDAIVSADEEQRIVYFNATAERLFRWPRAAVIGQRLDVLIPERFRKAHGTHIERFGRTAVTSRGMGAQTVIYGQRADGEEFPIEASISQHVEDGCKIFTVILRDVTERLRAEDQLARSEARLRGILDSAMDAIITVDDRQNIVLFNAAAEAVFGCPREQAIGVPLAWFIPERFRAGHGEHVRRFSETGTSSRRMGESRIVMGLRRSGEEFPIDASISQAVEHGQRFYTVILRDVTERVRNEAALKSSREEIRELAQAANNVREQEKSRIARELHDELGQALTALKIDVGWLKERVGGEATELKAKLDAMQLLLDGTVAAARRISADLRPLMLDDLGVAAAAEWLVQNFMNRTGIECRLDMADDGLDLQDPYATAVFRVLQESLTNVARHAQASKVEVRLARAGDVVSLVVRDDGQGFQLQAPRKPGSYGLLGLRERALLLGGEVEIESIPGEGTTVRMRLPVREAETVA